MADALVSRLGQQDLSGDVLANFLKVFAGEVITKFDRTVMLKELTSHRVITSGKSASFPAMFQAGVEYHTPGTEIAGGKIAHNEVVISIDDLLIAPVSIPNIDEAMNHYDVRAEYSKQIGEALAVAYDKNIARNLYRAANSPALFTGDVGGQSVTDADALTNAASLADSIWAAKQKMEEADVPVDTEVVNAILKPAQWYQLAQETDKVINRDVGGQADYANGRLTLIGGVNVRKANVFPWGTNDSANTDIPSAYRVDMSNTAGIVFTKDAAATVQLMGMSLENDYMVNRQSTLMVGRYAVGHGPKIPKCAVEIKTA